MHRHDVEEPAAGAVDAHPQGGTADVVEDLAAVVDGDRSQQWWQHADLLDLEHGQAAEHPGPDAAPVRGGHLGLPGPTEARSKQPGQVVQGGRGADLLHREYVDLQGRRHTGQRGQLRVVRREVRRGADAGVRPEQVLQVPRAYP